MEFGREAIKGICPGIPTKAHLKLVELQAFGKKIISLQKLRRHLNLSKFHEDSTYAGRRSSLDAPWSLLQKLQVVPGPETQLKNPVKGLSLELQELILPLSQGIEGSCLIFWHRGMREG